MAYGNLCMLSNEIVFTGLILVSRMTRPALVLILQLRAKCNDLALAMRKARRLHPKAVDQETLVGGVYSEAMISKLFSKSVWDNHAGSGDKM